MGFGCALGGPVGCAVAIAGAGGFFYGAAGA